MDKPYIICNMMTSIDGKIAYGTVNGKEVDFSPFGNYMPLYESIEREYGNDWSYLLGRITMDEVDSSEKTSLDEFKEIDIDEKEDFIAQKEYESFGICVDTKGALRWENNFRTFNNIKSGLIMIVTEQTPKEYLAYLKSKNISYILGGEQEVNFSTAFSKLKLKFGIKKLLLEGGGYINGSVIKEDLIDEISLMILPFVINNVEAPTLFYAKVQTPKLYHFKLVETKQIEEDILWLKYLKRPLS